MRHLRIFGVLTLVGAVLMVGAVSVSAAGGRPFATSLHGAEEVPGPGDADGQGWATITVNPGLGRICYTLDVSGIAPAAAAHIHEAPAGVAGPVVVPLTAPTDGSSAGCASVSRELAMSILRHPGDYYVNVHNADFPGGALRGQLGD